MNSKILLWHIPSSELFSYHTPPFVSHSQSWTTLWWFQILYTCEDLLSIWSFYLEFSFPRYPLGKILSPYSKCKCKSHLSGFTWLFYLILLSEHTTTLLWAPILQGLEFVHSNVCTLSMFVHYMSSSTGQLSLSYYYQTIVIKHLRYLQ